MNQYQQGCQMTTSLNKPWLSGIYTGDHTEHIFAVAVNSNSKHVRKLPLANSKIFFLSYLATLEVSSGANVIKPFVRNLRISVISLSVCPWQAFPA